MPRTAARVEDLGPFTLFINRHSGWPYYARPALGAVSFEVEDVRRVRARQRELGLPETFEWVAETTPALARAAEAAGLAVTYHPLMVLRDAQLAHAPPPAGVEIGRAAPEDDLAVLNAVARVAFAHPGTAAGSAGLDDARRAVERDPDALAAQQQRLRSGWTVTAVAYVEGQPVGVGSHQPIGAVTEVVGVGVLPAFRRRGIAAGLTRWLVGDALARGTRTIFLSAGDAAIARVYQRVGFQTLATACIAEPTTAHPRP